MNKNSFVTCESCGRTYGVKANQETKPYDLDGSAATAAYLTGWTRTTAGGWTCNLASCQDPFHEMKIKSPNEELLEAIRAASKAGNND